MNKKKKDPNFKINFVTDEDQRKIDQERITKLTEDQKSEYKFQGEYFYELGRGHEFLMGFFTEYITKNGLTAWEYDSGIWRIQDQDYTYSNGEFQAEPTHKTENRNIKWDEISFPKVQKIHAKSISDDLVPEVPRESLNKKKK